MTIKIKYIASTSKPGLHVRLDASRLVDGGGGSTLFYYALNEPACCLKTDPTCADGVHIQDVSVKSAELQCIELQKSIYGNVNEFIHHGGGDLVEEPYWFDITMPIGQGKDLDFIISLQGQDTPVGNLVSPPGIQVSYMAPTTNSLHEENAGTFFENGKNNKIQAVYITTDGTTKFILQGDNFGTSDFCKVNYFRKLADSDSSVTVTKREVHALTWVSHQEVSFQFPPGEGLESYRIQLEAANQVTCGSLFDVDSAVQLFDCVQYKLYYDKPKVSSWANSTSSLGCPALNEQCPTEGGFVVKILGTNFGTQNADIKVELSLFDTTSEQPVDASTIVCNINAWDHDWVECTVPQGHGGPYYPVVTVSGQSSDLNTQVKFKYNPPVITKITLCSKSNLLNDDCANNQMDPIPTTADWDDSVSTDCLLSTGQHRANSTIDSYRPIYLVVHGINFGLSPSVIVQNVNTQVLLSTKNSLVDIHTWTDTLDSNGGVGWHRRVKFRICVGESSGYQVAINASGFVTQFTKDFSYNYAPPEITSLKFLSTNAPLSQPSLVIPTSGCARTITSGEDVNDPTICADKPAYFEIHGRNFGLSKPKVSATSIDDKEIVGELPWNILENLEWRTTSMPRFMKDKSGNLLPTIECEVDQHTHLFIRVKVPVGQGRVRIGLLAQINRYAGCPGDEDQECPALTNPTMVYQYSQPVIGSIKWGQSLLSAMVDNYFNAIGSRKDEYGRRNQLFILGENFGEFESPVQIFIADKICSNAKWNVPEATSKGRPYLSCYVNSTTVGKQSLIMSVAASSDTLINKNHPSAPSARCFEGYYGIDGESCLECWHWDDEIYDRTEYSAKCSGRYIEVAGVPLQDKSTQQVGGTEEPINTKGFTMLPPPECLGQQCASSIYATELPEGCTTAPSLEIDDWNATKLLLKEQSTSMSSSLTSNTFDNQNEKIFTDICPLALQPGKHCHPLRNNSNRLTCRYIEVCQPAEACLENNTCNEAAGYVSYYDSYKKDGSCATGHFKLPLSAKEANVLIDSPNWGKCFAPKCTMCRIPSHFRLEGECVECPSIPWLLPLLMVAFGVGGSVAMYFLSRKGVNLTLLTIGVDYFQVLSMFTKSKVRWPEELNFLFTLFQWFQFDIDLTGPECAFRELFTYEMKWWVKALFPLLGTAIIGIMLPFIFMCTGAKGTKEEKAQKKLEKKIRNVQRKAEKAQVKSDDEAGLNNNVKVTPVEKSTMPITHPSLMKKKEADQDNTIIKDTKTTEQNKFKSAVKHNRVDLMFATHVRTKTRNTCTAMISTAISMFISMTYFLYVMMVRTSFSVFNCIEPLPKDGNRYMSDEPLEQCGKKGGLQDRLFIPALICIVLYCCILPLILYGIFHYNRKIIKKDQKLRAAKRGGTFKSNPHFEFRSRYGRLYKYFQPHLYWWINVILARKFCIIVLSIALRMYPSFQLACGLLVMFISFVLHLQFHPYLGDEEAALLMKNHMTRNILREENTVAFLKKLGGPTAASSPRVKKLEHRIHVQLRIVKNQDVILRNSHNILFNANTVESILLCCAIVILLSGVTFDSDFVLRNNTMRLTLTYAVITIILVSISYFVFVFIHEFRMTTKKHRAVKSLRWKNMASKARSMSNGYHGEDKDGDGKDDRMQSSNPFSINRKSKGGGLLAALKAKNASDAKEGREHRASGGKGGVGGSTDTVIAIYKEEEDNIFDLGSSDEEGDTKEKAMEKAMEKVEEIANVARTNGASKQDIAKQGAEALHALDISMRMNMSEIELFNGSSDDEEDDAAFNKIFPEKNIKKDTVKQDSLTQDSNLLYGVSKSKADQDVNKSAHLKAMHEAELHQIESDAHKQAAEIMQFSSKAILAHRFKAKAAQLRSEKRLQARIAAQQKARALEEIQRKQKEERQRKINVDEAKSAYALSDGQIHPATEMVTSSDEDEEVPAVALSVHVPASQLNHPMAEMDDTSSEDEDDDFFSNKALGL